MALYRLQHQHIEMKTLFALLLSVFAALGATVTNDMRDLQGAALNTPLIFTPLSVPLSNGTYMVAGPSKTYVPTAGRISITNLQPGSYYVDISGKRVRAEVPNDSLTYNLTALIQSNLVVYTYTNPVDITGITAAQATNIAAYQAKLATNGVSGGTSGALTNGDTRQINFAGGLWGTPFMVAGEIGRASCREKCRL